MKTVDAMTKNHVVPLLWLQLLYRARQCREQAMQKFLEEVCTGCSRLLYSYKTIYCSRIKALLAHALLGPKYVDENGRRFGQRWIHATKWWFEQGQIAKRSPISPKRGWQYEWSRTSSQFSEVIPPFSVLGSPSLRSTCFVIPAYHSVNTLNYFLFQT